MNRKSLVLILTMLCACACTVARAKPRYEYYAEKSFGGVSLEAISGIVNAAIDDSAQELKQYTSVDFIKFGSIWRRLATTDILVNNGWAVVITNKEITGRYYFYSVPTTKSLDSNLTPVQYLEFVIERHGGELKLSDLGAIATFGP